jgi:hypothetical protein
MVRTSTHDRGSISRISGVLMLRRTLIALFLAFGSLAVPSAAHAETYSAPLMTAISDLPVASEVRTGYSRDLFPHWIDRTGTAATPATRC